MQVKIQNVVASVTTGQTLDLDEIVKAFPEAEYKPHVFLERIMYEPEQFPGAVYRMDEPKVVILIFSNGKLVVTGAKSEEGAYQAAERLQKKLEERELIHYE
jgi:transcription initiation factor TFIID TATA-box-binding protein